ncbi:hypothetical protein [Streptomyces nogalater]|uniref:Gram-positive cocci surface proteins LPxTG domain-containing protein n=1 Tax=Streptomyces nogalater TaxID=38314 RepID=A0ABW0WS56_STRNO
MRPRTPLSRCRAAAAAAAAATVVLPVSPSAAHAQTPAAPSCAAADAHAFPLAARIRGGPASYAAGGSPRTWYIDLTNTTDRTCAGVHPVVVLVGEERALRPDQPRLDFYDGSRAHRVAFEATEARELVGVLDGTGFAGFTVPPGRTVGVRVRFSFAPGAAAGQVTATAAVVQRRGQDGDWVGESDAYRFSVTGDGEDGTEGEREDTGPAREAREAHALHPPGTPAPAPGDGRRAGQPARTAPAHAPLATVLTPLLALLAAAGGAFLLLRGRR